MWRGGADVALVYKLSGRKNLDKNAAEDDPFGDENAVSGTPTPM